MAYKCKKKMAKKSKEWYNANKELVVRRTRERKSRNLEFVRGYLKARVCVDCGNSNYVVLEFDHVRDKKVDTVSSMAHNGYSIERIEKEIEKCDIRCANCHKIRHHELRGGWSNRRTLGFDPKGSCATQGPPTIF